MVVNDKTGMLLALLASLNNPQKKIEIMLAERMRKIREIKGWKQSAVAKFMNITQQAYSILEQGRCNSKISTLERFCDAMEIKLSFLLAYDTPVTDENLDKYAKKGMAGIISENKVLEQKHEFLNYLIHNIQEGQSLGKTIPMVAVK